MTTERRIATLADSGLDKVVVVPFTRYLQSMDPATFVDHVLTGPLGAEHVVVGQNFRFGHKASGTTEALTRFGEQNGFSTDVVQLLCKTKAGKNGDNVVVSSTVVRELVLNGDVHGAAELLGRPHINEGVVVEGNKRGRTIGFPTANVAVEPELAVPAFGVYAGRVLLPDTGRLAVRDGGGAIEGLQTWHPAAISVGTNPTFDGVEGIRVEAHLLDFEGDLYGQQLAIAYTHRIRGQQAFGNVAELQHQIAADVAVARQLL